MTSQARCSACGKSLHPKLARAYDGACPWCLARVTFGPEPPGSSPGESGEGTGRLGKYVRTEKLGSGGMGEVWKALDTELNRWVALKFLKDDQPAVVARFLREARTAAGLSHPAIAAIHEVGELEGRHFIAMQYVPGRTMDSIPWKDRRLLVRLFRDVARALHHAHQSGIIHRDLKPSNLIVEMKGDNWGVAILDFGLARPIEGGERLSKSGEVFGTVPYMSPEQARGEPLDVRTDVYSLGATMYEVLTGRLPFVGKNLVGLIHRIEFEEPAPLRKRNPAIDRDLQTIVMACLEKDCRRRYRSAQDLADDLQRWLNREPILVRPPGALERLRRGLARRKAATAAVAAGLALASVLAWWAIVGSPAAEQARLSTDEARLLANQARLSAEAMKLWAEARGLGMAGVDPEGIRRRAGAAREAFDRAIAVKEDAPSLVMKSRCLQLEARDDDALQTTRRAYELDPANLEARLELAKLLLVKYRDSRSVPGYSSARTESGQVKVTFNRLPPESPDQLKMRQEAESLLAPGGASPALANLLNGLLAMGREDWPGAGPALAAYTKLENWDARGFQLEGMSRFFSREFQRAISALDSSLLRVPRAAAYRWRGIAKNIQGQDEQALADLTMAIELDENEFDAYEHRAVLLTHLGRFDEAISDSTKAIKLKPTRATGYVRRGLAKKRAGRLDEAIADYSMALEVDSDNDSAYSHRGTARSEKGDLDGAISDYTKAIKSNPTSPLPYSNRGLVKFSKGLFDEAIADFTKAIELDPGLSYSYAGRGCSKLSKRLFDEAIADFTKAIELEPALCDPYFNRAQSHMHKFVSKPVDAALLRSAIEDYEAALKRAPPDWSERTKSKKAISDAERNVLNLEASERFKSRDYREAIRKYAEIVKRWPQSGMVPAAAYNCACGYALLGEKENALDWLEKAVDTGWKDSARLEMDPDLDMLRDCERYQELLTKLKGK